MKKYLIGIALIFGALSLIRSLGVAFTYCPNLFIHNLGNALWLFPMLPFNTALFFIGSFLGIFVFIICLFTKVPFKVSLIPLLYSLIPALTFINIQGLLSDILVNNYFVIIYYLAVFAYSILVIRFYKK